MCALSTGKRTRSMGRGGRAIVFETAEYFIFQPQHVHPFPFESRMKLSPGAVAASAGSTRKT